MKNNNFFNNKIFKNIMLHFKINFRMVILFIVIWTLLTLILSLLTLPTYGIDFNKHMIATSMVNQSKSPSRGATFFGLNDILGQGLYSIPGFIFFGILITFFVNKILLNEVYTGQISMWMTQPMNRKNIIFSKMMFLLILVTLVQLPNIIIILSFGATAYDANENFVKLLIYVIMFFIFIQSFNLFVFWLAEILIEKKVLVNVIISLFMLYALIIWIPILIAEMSDDSLNNLLNIKWIWPLSLAPNTLIPDFSKDQIETIVFEDENKVITLSTYVLKNVKNYQWIVSSILLTIFIVGFPILTINNFKNKSLSI